MKKTYFELQRFADSAAGGSETSCDAETAVCNTDASTAEDTSVIMDDMTGSDVKMIAEALNIDGDGAAVLESINSAKLRQSLERIFRERSAAKAYERLISEAEQLSEKIGGFSIEKELENKKFSAMLRSGLSVEEAWQASHFNELFAAAVQYGKEEAEKNMLLSLKNTAERPAENGAVGQAAARSRTSAENLTGKGIREILRRVEGGAKIRF